MGGGGVFSITQLDGITFCLSFCRHIASAYVCLQNLPHSPQGRQHSSILDSILGIALCYVVAFFILGMASFHYFVPANVLKCLYMLFFWNLYKEHILHSIITKCIHTLCALIFVLNVLPQSLHYYSFNKIQMHNYEVALHFLPTMLLHQHKNQKCISMDFMIVDIISGRMQPIIHFYLY